METRDPIKVTYSVALHCPYNAVLGKEISLILSGLTPPCNMQWPNGKSVLEILPLQNILGAEDFPVSLKCRPVTNNPHGSTLPVSKQTRPHRHLHTDYVTIQILNCFFRTGEMFIEGEKTSSLPNQKRKWIDTRLTNFAYAFFKCPPELVTCKRVTTANHIEIPSGLSNNCWAVLCHSSEQTMFVILASRRKSIITVTVTQYLLRWCSHEPPDMVELGGCMTSETSVEILVAPMGTSQAFSKSNIFG